MKLMTTNRNLGIFIVLERRGGESVGSEAWRRWTFDLVAHGH